MPFLLIFLIIFVFIPLTELYVIIEVGDQIGAFATIWLVVLTAVIGGWLVRKQGMGILFRIRQQMEQGEAPAIEMLEGALLADHLAARHLRAPISGALKVDSITTS